MLILPCVSTLLEAWCPKRSTSYKRLTVVIFMRKIAKSNMIEMKLYEYFGIRLFRKLVLKLECLTHYKDKHKNANYHFHGRDINSVQSFIGYLLYNAIFHCLSIFFIGVYFAITCIYKCRYIALDISMFVLLFLNLYCIILQRYNYIKIRGFVKEHNNANNKKIADKIELLSKTIGNRSYNELQKEYLLIERIRESIDNGTDCVIEICDASVLRSITKSFRDTFNTNYRCEKRNNDGKSPENLIQRVPKHPVVTQKIEKRVSSLQNVFNLSKRSNVLFGFSVITETKDCEDAFRELIQDASRDSVEFVFDVLFGAYNKTMLSLKGTQV